MNTGKIKVLFICSHNAGRSQMAEGYLNARYGDRYEAMSAGFCASRINPATINVMAEIGIDIGAQYSKALMEFKDEKFDIIVILAGVPGEHELPIPEAKTCIHKNFTDPRSFHGNSDAVLAGFMLVRDDITGWIDVYFGPARD